MKTSIVPLVLFLYLLGTVLSSPTNKEIQSSPSSASKKEVAPNANESKINEIEDEGWEYENQTIVDTRRILYSKTVAKGKRPYMVYLQLTKESAKAHKYRGWLCGGVIVDAHYVLTSAACVEDADHFYVVSGTTKFVDSFDYKTDDCVCKNRRKVVWKCIPKNYKFDFQDSIKWSSNDIAIVKVNKPFKFGVNEPGCEFPTALICYNNISRELEKAGTKGYIAGWGSGSNFREGVYRATSGHVPENAGCLQEAKVCVMDNEQCSKKWAPRFRSIITQYMICTKDVMKRLSEICDKKYANCTDVETRRHIEDPGEDHSLDLGRHLRDPDDYTARRSTAQGGFCENDHGGPLIVKYQGKERVIGVISACKIDPKSHSCHGPFLYTSVFKNRQFISCAINKDVEESCRRVFRTGITHEEWTVNWNGVEEDDNQDQNRDDKQDQDSDEQDEDSPLRAKSENKKETTMKKDPDTSDDSSDADPDLEKKKIQHDKKGNSKHVKSADKSKTKTSKHKSHGKHAVPKREAEKKDKVAKEKTGNLRQDDKEVFYQSSRDENVNEPDEDEK